MAVAQGSCPGCGAPIEFGVGSSLAKVCSYCNSTVVRSDRGLENLGKVAEIAQTPSLVAVGDQGQLATRPFEVMGRVQLDHGKGPWDEYYVSFDHGQSWGWLAYAQGRWHVTSHVAGYAVPPYNSLQLEQVIDLGGQPFTVAEIKSSTTVSAEGELPSADPPGTTNYYVDLYGPNNAFATIDYGNNSGTYEVFIGWIFGEDQMNVSQLGPRHTEEIDTGQIQCPSCGGDVPKLSGNRAERLGCPYCGAVSDIGSRQVVAQQEAAMSQPDIPIGSKGTFDNLEYICIAYVKRGTSFEGEPYAWEEFLIWNQNVGYRWLVKDPETGWSWVVPASVADMDLSGMPNQVAWGGRAFSCRNRGSATVEYVLGEVYWKCEVGETTATADYVNGQEVLSREEGEGEVNWSHSSPIAWPVLAQAFNLPVDGPGARFGVAGGGGGGWDGQSYSGQTASTEQGGCGQTAVLLIVVGVVLMICMLGACGACGGGGGGYSSGGSGVYYGGK